MTTKSDTLKLCQEFFWAGQYGQNALEDLRGGPTCTQEHEYFAMSLNRGSQENSVEEEGYGIWGLWKRGWWAGQWPLATGHVQWLTDSRRDMASSWMSTFRYIDTLTRGLQPPAPVPHVLHQRMMHSTLRLFPQLEMVIVAFSSHQAARPCRQLVSSANRPARSLDLGPIPGPKTTDHRPETSDHNIKLQMMRWCPTSNSKMMSYRSRHHHHHRRRAFN